MHRHLESLVAESGLPTLLAAPRDVHLLLLSRAVRFIAYGQSTLVLTHHLSTELGWSDFSMGLFMTLTLVGDVAGSWILTAYADKWGRRRVLSVGAGLMAISGAVFASTSAFGWLLAAAVVGVISPR
jgi:MFS family permease